MTCRLGLGGNGGPPLSLLERPPGQACRTCAGYVFGECRKFDGRFGTTIIGSRQVDPDAWCPSFALKGGMHAAARVLGPILVERK